MRKKRDKSMNKEKKKINYDFLFSFLVNIKSLEINMMRILLLARQMKVM